MVGAGGRKRSNGVVLLSTQDENPYVIAWLGSTPPAFTTVCGVEYFLRMVRGRFMEYELLRYSRNAQHQVHAQVSYQTLGSVRTSLCRHLGLFDRVNERVHSTSEAARRTTNVVYRRPSVIDRFSIDVRA